jgi:hypothetical protein
MRTPTNRFCFSVVAASIFSPRNELREYSRSKRDCRRPILLCVLLSLIGAGVQAAEPPILSAIPDQVTTEDQPILQVPFTVSDADSPLEQLRFRTSFFFNDTHLSAGRIVLGGTGSNRWCSIYPLADGSGLASVSIMVADETALKAEILFRVQINPVNDPPRLSFITDQTAVRGQYSLSVPFSVSDPDTPLNQVRLTAWSSRQSVVDNASLRFTSGTTSTNRNLLITIPTNGVAGSTAITIQADDSQSSNTVFFVLNVQPPDFAPSGNSVPVLAEEPFRPIWGDFNGDGLLDLVASSRQIYTNAGNGSFSAGIPLPIGILASGASAADFDGDGNLDLLFYGTGAPRLFRNSGGPEPRFSEVPITGAPSLLFAGRFQWADMDGDGALDIVGGSREIQWLQNNGAGGFTGFGTGVPSPSQLGVGMIAIGDVDNDGYPDILATVGTATASPRLRLYFNDGTGSLVDSQVDLPQIYIKAAGWIDVDGDGSLDLWLLQSPTVVPAPTNSLVVLRQNGGRFDELYRLTDPVPTANPLIPVWADFDNDGNNDFVGSYWPPQPPFIRRTNYPAVYRNDGHGQFTTQGLPVTADLGQLATAVADFDDDGSPDLLTRIGNGFVPLRNQGRAINALPDAPTSLRAMVAGNIVILSWNSAADANQATALSYNVRVGTAPGKNDVVASMSTTNGARMLPALGDAGYRDWFTLKLPLERLSVEKLYWSVQAVDNGFQGGPFAREQTFFINPPGNQPPVIAGITDLTIPEDTTNTLTLYVTDDRTAPDLLLVRATSSNTNLFPSASVTLSGFTVTNQALKVNLNLNPRADQTGQAVITVTASDRAGLSTSRSFVVTVTPVNDPPVLVVSSVVLAFAGAPAPPFPVSASDEESPIEQLSLSARSLSPAIVPDTNLFVSRTAGGWQVLAVPTNSEPSEAVIRLTVRDPDGAADERDVTIRFQAQLFSTFAAETVTGNWPNALIWADLNGDRTLDLLVGNAFGWGLTVHSVQADGLPVVARLTPPMTEGAPVDVGDVDNDGNIDVLARTLVMDGDVGRDKLVVSRNLGNFVFEQVPGAVFDPGAALFADFDQDGRIDVWVAADATNLVVYHNNGIGFDAARPVELIAPAPAELETATGLEVIDLDGDGIPELMISKYGGLSGTRSRTVYRRQGDSFEAVGSGAAQPQISADFDSDGILDLLEFGSTSNQLLLGGAGMVFTPIELPFASAYAPFVAPGDFDGDGVLDVAVDMESKNLSVLQFQVAVYRGQSRHANHPPTSPSNLRMTSVATNVALLSWSRATDPEQSSGLTYNVRVGTAPGLGDVVSPMSLSDGHRLVPRRGNAEWNTNFFLAALEPGRTYFWSVQAIDNSFAGGPFATETIFTLPDAVLSVHSAGTRGFELELRAAPDGSWQVETSNDLQTWQPYSITGVTMQAGSNGASRLDIDVTAQRQFFRARRIN